MIKNLIKSGAVKTAPPPEIIDTLKISELFSRTIQGEGVSIGCPATFLRLTNCTLNCRWCDTGEVWKKGGEWSFQELFDLIESEGVVEDLKKGHKFVITGGSPLLQQTKIIKFIETFKRKYGFFPEVEIENECVLMPLPQLIKLVSQWNNSPKLENSGMKKSLRHKPTIISLTSKLKNSWFKFVVKGEDCIEEIKKDFINNNLINPNQVILMPCADSLIELSSLREKVIELAVKEGWRFSDRLHITVWDKKTGV
jgi:organic radical activating enzyme